MNLKKIVSTLLSIVYMIMALFGVNPMNKSDLNADVVNVFVHGLGGWGDYDALNQAMPYWGMNGGKLLDMLEDEGYECYAASMGPISSAWDRACELYAQLTGGTVDYGEAHSAEHNHARYGRTYEALFDGWSAERKINLLAHSFGAPTARLFAQLCAEGDEAERAATSEDEISPLFLGGLNDRIHSVTSLGGVNNGSSSAGEPNEENSLMKTFMTMVKYMGNMPIISGIYDFKLEHFGLTIPPAQWTWGNITDENIDNFVSGTDNAGYDLTIVGAMELNDKTKLDEDIYYFTYALCATEFDENGKLIISPSVNKNTPAMIVASSLDMRQDEMPYTVGGLTIDEAWLPHDGMVNVISALHPFGQDFTEFDENSIEPGIWNEMPIINGVEHMYFMLGDGSGDISELFDFFMQHFAYLETTY